MFITQADRVALLAGGAVAAVVSAVFLLLGPVTAKIDPSQLPDPRPVVVSNNTYTPFTQKPTRPPHPASIYTPPAYEGGAVVGQPGDNTLGGLFPEGR